MNSPNEEPRISRRKMLVRSASCVLLASPGVYILGRKLTKPRPKVLTFEGPFSYEEDLPISNTEDFPVEISWIAFECEGLGNYLGLAFTFRGKKDPERVIDVGVTITDRNGNVCVSHTMHALDARLAPRQSPNGAVPFRVNSHHYNLDNVSPSEVGRIELSFLSR